MIKNELIVLLDKIHLKIYSKNDRRQIDRKLKNLGRGCKNCRKCDLVIDHFQWFTLFFFKQNNFIIELEVDPMILYFRVKNRVMNKKKEVTLYIE